MTDDVLALEAWPTALATALPALACSALFAARLAGAPWLDGRAFSLAGLIVVGLCLAAAMLAGAVGLPAQRACLAAAGGLGLTTPALALHLSLAQRAYHDPVMIAIMPALLSLGLLAGCAVIAWALPMSRRPPPAELGPCLLPTGLLLLWTPALAPHAEEPLVWAAIALSFALSAAAWFAAPLLRGWAAIAPCIVAVGLVVLATLGLPAAPPATGDAETLAAAELALAFVGGLLPLVVPAATVAWRRWRAPRGAA
jgi:hypothetical protein